MFAFYIFIIVFLTSIITFSTHRITNIYNKDKINVNKYSSLIIIFISTLILLSFLAYFSKEVNLKYFIINTIYIALLILISNIDYNSKIIPNKIIIIGTLLSIILFTLNSDSIQLNGKSLILESFLGSFLGFSIMMFFYLLPFTRIGAGDVKLSALIGAISGFQKIIFALSSGIIFAGIISIILILSKKKSINDDIAFGPYICSGTIFIILLGDHITKIIPRLY
tara:strand:+ start:11014 stop:11685 length:672 start_codon:yes stop_codon:yes gene_type:complete